MFHRLSDSDTTFVGLDVHKNSITSAVLVPSSDLAVVDRFFPDEPSIRRFVGALGDPGSLAVCYEAGPTGYALARFLGKMGIACEVIAPSLIPMASGARVKNDRRDARRLVELHRVGQLTPVRIPTEAEEAIRDLCRTRSDLVTDRTRARHRLIKFLLRHNVVFRDGSHWTLRHEAWLAKVRFDDEALTRTFARYRSMLSALDAELGAVESDLRIYFEQGPFTESVARLAAYRGVTELGALALGAEVGDWTRFPRATSFMGFCGLTPSEYSSGDRTKRGRITKTGNVHLRTALVESAWSYQHRPATGAVIARRQARASDETVARAWKAQIHLTTKFSRLAATKSSRNVVVTAVARELAGFLWAEMIA
ncbi:MAG: IS110 family RNA-guided transposase [Acidimicrobiales bacterium]